jgi:predicted dinucleotide-binding enzyme
MTIAIIGTGNIGKAVGRQLVDGGEFVIFASRDKSHADALASELGGNAKSATLTEAIAASDTVFLALWLDAMKEFLGKYKNSLDDKIIIDPSNPISFAEDGKVRRTLPDGTSAGMVISSLLPVSVHYVKAFGTLGADSLAKSANGAPEKVVLFYATNDAKAEKTIVRLITEAGFDPVKAGGINDTLRVEFFGDLNGKPLNKVEAEAAVRAETSGTSK